MTLLASTYISNTHTYIFYVFSLHDALPISAGRDAVRGRQRRADLAAAERPLHPAAGARGVEVARQLRDRLAGDRSEEHTSELQSPDHIVCRFLLEKKIKNIINSRFNCKLEH